MAAHRVAYASLVLPEVLKNPVAYFNFNKDQKINSDIITALSKLTGKPRFYARRLQHKRTAALHSPSPKLQLHNKFNRIKQKQRQQ